MANFMLAKFWMLSKWVYFLPPHFAGEGGLLCPPMYIIGHLNAIEYTWIKKQS